MSSSPEDANLVNTRASQGFRLPFVASSALNLHARKVSETRTESDSVEILQLVSRSQVFLPGGSVLPVWIQIVAHLLTVKHNLGIKILALQAAEM